MVNLCIWGYRELYCAFLYYVMMSMNSDFFKPASFPALIVWIYFFQVLSRIREILQQTFITKNKAKDGHDIAEAAARQVA